MNPMQKQLLVYGVAVMFAMLKPKDEHGRSVTFRQV
jgi:hypothetical protein